MGTRIQDRSRPTKRPMATADYATDTGSITVTGGRMPALDVRGYPAYKGLPAPVLVGVTVVDP